MKHTPDQCPSGACPECFGVISADPVKWAKWGRDTQEKIRAASRGRAVLRTTSPSPTQDEWNQNFRSPVPLAKPARPSAIRPAPPDTRTQAQKTTVPSPTGPDPRVQRQAFLNDLIKERQRCLKH